MVHVKYSVVEGGELFLAFHQHLQRLYPGNCTLAADDPVVTTGQLPVCGDSQLGYYGG